MIYLWTFLAISILAVSGYIGQVMGAFSAVSSFTGMVILAALIYLLNVWLQDGDDIVSGLLMFSGDGPVIIQITLFWMPTEIKG
ncbi:hypothetical protein A7T33_12895 [Salmonella enterica subsp. enterica serovar Newport]|nr:DUF2545 family protein [Salmonella enterica]OHM67850.1 hypothetical protein A7T33_12895 [Salmonella enterica subsp. enterica serovar Newport]